MADLKLEVKAGSVCRDHSILRMPLTLDLRGLRGDLNATCNDGATLPAQIDEDENELVLVMPRLMAGGSERLMISASGCACCSCGCETSMVEAEPVEGGIEVRLNGALWTRYNAPNATDLKPYLAPVIGPYGDDVVRAVKPGIAEHPHHKGIFIAHGSVCGEEIWNEPAPNCGRCEQKSINAVSGSVFAKIAVDVVWLNRSGKPLMDEKRSYWFYNTPAEARVIDLKLDFRAAYGDVVLGDTKEAGFLAIRIHPDMNGSAGLGGRMENCYGGIGEAECWGKKSHWCDYHGIVGGNRVGIAAFDHASNLRFPTRWHIRDYGLFAANPWFWDGPYTIPAGQSLVFRHRLIVHAGDTAAARIGRRYADYDVPMKAERL